ncbi:5'/3'-nucleotidase SurE [Saccharothrix australiensis]|uniref:5'-nucleotidase n=1 Tax=Saccharothrix australiensis TaxID=2072 RepID=A0A495W7Q6_9PSEU|nr:5'/3'-nucleotidase SurE [Saccharothrix australiensis]RKT57781.1 5'-nucleotidase /3'-nucleotidase /exopolyphosphatase [Saccharothrix australiensis]
MILATNDDGVAAPGLAALVRALEAAGVEHVVFGNEEGWTGAGAAMAVPSGRPSIVRVVGDAWSFRDSTPALMVASAFSGLAGPAPRGVVVGINHGPNVGRMTEFSGTVGAAITAAAFGASAVAVSSDDVYSTHGREDGPLEGELAGELAVTLLDAALDLGRGVALSLNVPNLDRGLVRGLRVAPPAPVLPFVRCSSTGELTWAPRAVEAPEGSDVALLAAGFATVTVVRGAVAPDELAARVAIIEADRWGGRPVPARLAQEV